MTAANPLARYGAMGSALRERVAPAELHHHSGHDLFRGALRVSRAVSNDAIDLAAPKVPAQVDARAVPMIVEAPTWDRIPGPVRVEESDTLPTRIAEAGIGDAVRPKSAQARSKRLALRVIVGIERREKSRVAASDVMQPRVDAQDDLAELRGPPGGFIGARHEPAVMKNGLEERDLERIAGIENAERPIAKTAGSIDTDVGEGRHQVTGAMPGRSPARRHQIEVADRLHQPRIGFPFGRDDERPVRGIRYVFEEVDRRVEASDDSDCARPFDLGERHSGDVNHQPPRSLSRYRRTRMRSVSSPPSMTSKAVRSANAAFGA